jgi:glycosyltransferase involved in cell wall biosynthesis/organic radical activating enzyme
MIIDLILPIKDRFEQLIEKLNIFKIVSTSITSSDAIELRLLIISDGNDATYNSNLIKYIESIGVCGVSLCVLKENCGPGAARNEGIRISGGDFIGFIDSDDELSCAYLNNVIEYFKINKVDDFVYIEHETTHLFHKTVLKNFNYKLAFYLNLIAPDPPRFIVSRTYLIKNDITFGDYLHEDLIFSFKVIANSSVFKIARLDGYKKILREDSITATITEKHIDGYFYAYKELTEYAATKQIVSEKWIGFCYAIARTIREIAKLKINKQELFTRIDKHISIDVRSSILSWLKGEVKTPNWFPKFFSDTTYYNILRLYFSNESQEIILSSAKKQVGCKDIEGSLFLAPKELRTCCKRFFRNGFRKGDVKLLDLASLPEKYPISELILSRKRELLSEISLGVSEECGQCPHLTKKDSINFSKINYLSIEDHTICNMRCTYCDEMYYGGDKSSGYINKLLGELSAKIDFSPEVVVWGGGEPTISNDFHAISTELCKLPSVTSLRVLTNALIYSEELADLLKSLPNSQVITSIDAGTPETFKIIRGVNKGTYLKRVIDNLKSYGEVAPGRITLKYIFCDENANKFEIDSFLQLCSENLLSGFTLHISNDFKSPKIDKSRLEMILYLFYASKDFFQGGVIIDEIIRRRIDFNDREIISFLTIKLQNDLYKPSHLVLVGSGEMLDLVKNSMMIKLIQNIVIVDVAKIENNLEINKQLTEGSEIFIAAVQGYTLIKRKLDRLYGSNIRYSKMLLL